MKPTTTLSILAIAAISLVSACDSTGPEAPDLTGIWDGTSAVATNPANGDSVDLVRDQGVSMTLTIEADNSVELRAVLDDFEDVEQGTIELSGDDVTLRLDGDPSVGTWSLDGDTLTLNLRNGVEWDVDEDDWRNR